MNVGGFDPESGPGAALRSVTGILLPSGLGGLSDPASSGKAQAGQIDRLVRGCRNERRRRSCRNASDQVGCSARIALGGGLRRSSSRKGAKMAPRVDSPDGVGLAPAPLLRMAQGKHSASRPGLLPLRSLAMLVSFESALVGPAR